MGLGFGSERLASQPNPSTPADPVADCDALEPLTVVSPVRNPDRRRGPPFPARDCGSRRTVARIPEFPAPGVRAESCLATESPRP